MRMEKNSEKKPDIKHLTAVESMVSVERVSLNITQSVIVTTEDKVRLSLESYVKKQSRRTEWIAPFSILVAILAALATANFHDFLLDAATWKAMFLISGIGSLVWLIKALYSLKNPVSIDDLIEDMRSGNTHGNLNKQEEDAK
jgi:hypothetical protein